MKIYNQKLMTDIAALFLTLNKKFLNLLQKSERKELYICNQSQTKKPMIHFFLEKWGDSWCYSIMLFICLLGLTTTASSAVPVFPQVSYQTEGLNVSISWTEVSEATGYMLYYAPKPYKVIGDAFETNQIQATYERYSALIEPYATTELSGYSFLEGANDFYSALNELNEHAERRTEQVSSYFDGTLAPATDGTGGMPPAPTGDAGGTRPPQ